MNRRSFLSLFAAAPMAQIVAVKHDIVIAGRGYRAHILEIRLLIRRTPEIRALLVTNPDGLDHLSQAQTSGKVLSITANRRENKWSGKGHIIRLTPWNVNGSDLVECEIRMTS